MRESTSAFSIHVVTAESMLDGGFTLEYSHDRPDGEKGLKTNTFGVDPARHISVRLIN
jgi:hypothetical protein